MQIELASQNSPLVIAVQNNNGILVPIQGLDQFLYGDKDLRILCSLYGQSLFDILYDDHGLIRYEDNKFALSKIIELDTNRTVMSIAGKVGESVVVRRCKQYANLNLLWMRIASGKQVQRSTAIRYRAVGTGFKSTERDYSKVYNPQDTQRDIIWLDDEGFRYQIAGSTSIAGIDAGLQVKVSTDGMRYVYHGVLDSIYEIPLVYFDLNTIVATTYAQLFDGEKVSIQVFTIYIFLGQQSLFPEAFAVFLAGWENARRFLSGCFLFALNRLLPLVYYFIKQHAHLMKVCSCRF